MGLDAFKSKLTSWYTQIWLVISASQTVISAIYPVNHQSSEQDSD